ncbi:PadR family transcriptional regulator [Nitrospirillum sp. BR 11828]|uniref:PadR family transcriptional regulator n=1 Tax=Nitrospirillum sp. BR 11828 TaxID=3104325 RepID=UPI002ACA46DD|nr:PadR family transcriptional regulator [Nitrospirillum sp. BR 11828]MDZ5649102.1 PadR family transcriptional regulator [Nitrospirillum sp. BR 11828]
MKAELLILGVLQGGDLHPYEIKRRLTAAHVDHYIDVDVGTLYYAVRSLARDGLIEAKGVEAVARGGERTTYGLTAAGRARFHALMAERLADLTPRYHPLYPALMFLHHADPATVATALRQRLEAQRDYHAPLKALADYLAPIHSTGMRAILENGLAHLETENTWLAKLVETLETGDIRPPDYDAARRLGLFPGGQAPFLPPGYQQLPPPPAAKAARAKRSRKAPKPTPIPPSP